MRCANQLHQKVQKDMIEKMFGAMMPKGASKLQLSKMNMGGMGFMMIKQKKCKYIRRINSNSPSKWRKTSRMYNEYGRHENIESVYFGGLASYLSETDDAYLNLFV